MTIQEEIKEFKSIIDQMYKTFEKKRKDYGQTTSESYDKFGPVSLVIRMHDKLSRIDNLLVKNQKSQVVNESVEDTLIDLANYAVIALLELKKRRPK